MNKKSLIIVVVLLLLLLGGGGLFLATRKSNTNNAFTSTKEETSMQGSPTSTSKSAAKGSLKSLLAMGTAQSCTYSTDTSSGSVSGTVYTANGKMRGDFTTSGGQQTVNGHMIVDSSFSYFWTEGSKQGIKTAITRGDNSSGTSTDNSGNNKDNQSSEQGGTSLNQDVNYNCSAWAEDDSKFTPPTDVTFSSFAVPSASPSGSSSTGGNQSACAYCNGLSTSDQVATCKAQLRCQ